MKEMEGILLFSREGKLLLLVNPRTFGEAQKISDMNK